MQMDTVGKKKELEIERFFFSKDKYKLFHDTFLNSTYINLYWIEFEELEF